MHLVPARKRKIDAAVLQVSNLTLGPMIRQPGRENQLYVHGREDPLQFEGELGPLVRNCRRTLLTQLMDRFKGWTLLHMESSP